MNKLIRRLAMAFVSISMAVGVGVAVGGNKDVVPVKAAVDTDNVETLSCSKGSISENTMSFSTTSFNVVHAQGDGSNFAAYTPWRIYNSNTITISSKDSTTKIAKVEFVHSGTYYGSLTCDNSNGTVTMASTSGGTSNWVLDDPDDASTATTSLVFTNTANTQSRFSEIKIYPYKVSSFGTLDSIAVDVENSTHATTFDVGDTFSSTGLVLTATDTGGKTKSVTSGFTCSGYNMSTAGNQTVTVSYTLGDVTKTTTYQITVNAAPVYTGGMNNFDWTSYNNSTVYTDAALVDSNSISGKSLSWQASSFETYSSKSVFVLGDYSTTHGTWANFSALENFAHIQLGLAQNDLDEASRTYALFSKNFGIVDLNRAVFEWTATVGTGLTVSILTSSDNGLTWSKVATDTASGAGSISWSGSTYSGSVTVEIALVLTSTSTATGSTAPALRNITWKLYGTSLNESVTYKATSVTVSADSNNVVSGETLALTSTLAPSFASDTVTYSVTAASPAGCATVNSSTGVVTGVAQGTATITATTSGGKTGTFNVNVGAARVYVTGVSITEGATANVALNHTLQLHAVVTPNNATTNTVTWSTGNSSVATVSSTGLVTPAAQGTVSITATCDGQTEGGEYPSASITVSVGPTEYDNKASAVLTSGKQYKIVAPVKDGDNVINYYLHSNGNTTQPTGTTNSWEATPFTFTLVGNNTWEITNGSDYLKFTGTNNGYCRVTSGSDTWVLDNAANTSTYAGDWSIKSVNGGNRFLCLYNNEKFQGYASESTNRNANISFVPFDADEYAQDIVNATSTVCSNGYDNAKADFTTAGQGETPIWTYLTNNYAFLSSDDKALLVGATYDRVGSTVTKTGSTTQTVAEGVARHDYLVGKYQLDNILTGRIVPSLSNSAIIGLINGEENGSISAIIVIISLVSLTAVGGYFVIRRRKENN